ncbi:MAG: SET domain-containing protein [Hyphomicrobiaceae bacterium]|nr:SET domain-containing protein [Hyphomicrobiaceae bacterium]
MILFKTVIGPSSIAGTGLFAAEPIPKGAAWWRFTAGFDRIITQAELDALPAKAQDYLRTYAYLQNGVWVLCGDHGIFTNHSDHPNSVTRGNESVALRNIAAGEEITEDYREFCEDWHMIPFLRDARPSLNGSAGLNGAAG